MINSHLFSQSITESIFRFQWCETLGTPRKTTGNWTLVRSQQRWCVATSKMSCISSLSSPPKWKQRAWIEDQESRKASMLRSSSAVRSPSKTCWEKTQLQLFHRLKRSSSFIRITDKLQKREISTGSLNRFCWVKLLLEVPHSGQQGAAHPTASTLQECLNQCGLQEQTLQIIAHTAVTLFLNHFIKVFLYIFQKLVFCLKENSREQKCCTFLKIWRTGLKKPFVKCNTWTLISAAEVTQQVA